MSNYDDLAARAEVGALRPVRGTLKRGADAARESQQALMAAVGASTLEEAATLALGRPSLDPAGGKAREWKVKSAPALDDAMREAAARVGVNYSQFIRDAVLEKVRAVMPDAFHAPQH